jgi:hypothetical protein
MSFMRTEGGKSMVFEPINRPPPPQMKKDLLLPKENFSPEIIKDLSLPKANFLHLCKRKWYLHNSRYRYQFREKKFSSLRVGAGVAV